MKVQYIQSACVIVEHNGVQVLCDPWLTDGAYYGSWYHYPELACRPEDFSGVDYIYISHVHPDHFDPATLRRLPRSIPVLIHSYAEKFLLRMIEQLGFTVREIAHRDIMPLGADFTLECLAADGCDPVVCGRFFGCRMPTPYTKTIQIDSLAVFHGGGRTVVNANDCHYALARGGCDYLRSKYDEIDMLLVGYSGAGAYPQCFDNLSVEARALKSADKRRQFLDQALDYVSHLRPRWFMPFAGQYLLGGRLSVLNGHRGVPEIEELPGELGAGLLDRNLNSEMVLLDSSAWFDVDAGAASAVFHPPAPSDRRRYTDTVLATKLLAYEGDAGTPRAEWVDLTPQLTLAHQRMRRHQERFDYRPHMALYLDCGQDYLYRIPFDGGDVQSAARGTEEEPYVRVGLDYSLLQMILNRQAHWDNAEIGSHLRFFRSPDVYDRAIPFLISRLHC